MNMPRHIRTKPNQVDILAAVVRQTMGGGVASLFLRGTLGLIFNMSEPWKLNGL